MNYNTQRAMVNRSKTDYDEAAKVSADAYKVYEEYKAKLILYLKNIIE